MSCAIEFAEQGFGSGGCSEHSSCLTEPMLARAKMNPLLAKSEDIRDSGGLI